MSARGGSGRVCIRGGTVVTCDDRCTVERADVLLGSGRILAVGRRLSPSGARFVDASDCLVLPGLVQSHVHLCQTLMRGLADDLPLLDWLRRRIWPLEAAHDEATLVASAELGLAELLLAGTTSILDLGTVHDHDVVFDACVRSGIRVCGGKTLMDRGVGVPRRLREGTSEALRSAEGLERRWSAHPSGRVAYAWIPRFVLSCSRRLVRGAVERASVSNARLHTHAAEHPGERRAVRKALGADDVDVLGRWGFGGERASIAHGVQLTRAQGKRLARAGVGVVHCPSANLKLGSGVARLADLVRDGVVVGLGADGAPCNNNLDPWVEMRRAALLSSMTAGPGRLQAREVLRMATAGGARLLGLEREVGCIKKGMRADVIVVRADGPHVAPMQDPVRALVYATQARDVAHVFVDGRQVVRGGELMTLDARRVVGTARRQAKRLVARADLA